MVYAFKVKRTKPILLNMKESASRMRIPAFKTNHHNQLPPTKILLTDSRQPSGNLWPDSVFDAILNSAILERSRHKGQKSSFVIGPVQGLRFPSHSLEHVSPRCIMESNSLAKGERHPGCLSLIECHSEKSPFFLNLIYFTAVQLCVRTLIYQLKCGLHCFSLCW